MIEFAAISMSAETLNVICKRLYNEWWRACDERDKAEQKVEELTTQLVIYRDAQKTITALEAQVASLQSALDHYRTQQPQSSNHMAKSVDELDLSVRAANCLQALGIETIEQLTKASFNRLLSQKHLTKKVLEEIRTELGKLGLKLKGDK